LARLTNVIATNANALNDKFYNDYSDLTSKSRSISAKQIQKITPAMKQKYGQKEINQQVNNAVQSVLLNKKSTKEILDDMVKNLSVLSSQ